MSNGSVAGSGNSSFHVEKLLEDRTRFRELMKENMFKDCQSESVKPIGRSEMQTKTLCQIQKDDKKSILQLERELNNCCQEIDYLQDQLNERNSEVQFLQEHVCSLQLKLLDVNFFEEEVTRLREELKMSESERSYLLQELENNYVELYSGKQRIEQLEKSISSTELDFQCEIEGMKLNLLEMEQKYLDAKTSQEEATKENARMKRLIQELELQIQEEEEIAECHKKNRDVEKMDVVNPLVEEHSQRWLADEDQLSSVLTGDPSNCCVNLGIKFVNLQKSNTKLREKISTMSHEMHEYEHRVEQLKEELKEERLKAKEEAEDLAQEMAELRYHLTGLLEAEYQRRACVERKSLQRISELEAELEKERCKSFNHQEQVRSATARRHIQAS